jgi:hypothetical protein
MLHIFSTRDVRKLPLHALDLLLGLTVSMTTMISEEVMMTAATTIDVPLL